MKWKQITPDGSGVAALLIGGAAILLLTFLSLPSHQIRFARDLDVSREAPPVLYWACECTVVLTGIVCLVMGVRLRTLIRQQRKQERKLEQQAIDSFIRNQPRD